MVDKIKQAYKKRTKALSVFISKALDKIKRALKITFTPFAKRMQQFLTIVLTMAMLFSLYLVYSCVNSFELLKYVIMFILCLIFCYLANKE